MNLRELNLTFRFHVHCSIHLFQCVKVLDSEEKYFHKGSVTENTLFVYKQDKNFR